MAKSRLAYLAGVIMALAGSAHAQEEARAVEASFQLAPTALPTGVTAPPALLDRVLLASAQNRRELESALNSFSPKSQPFEYAAMSWLVTHLEGHGYARFTWFDRYGDRIDIPLEAFERPATFTGYWAALERERGPLQAGVERFEGDALSLTAEELRQHVELAVRAWRERPWTWELDPALFFAGVLPHRIGNEAIDDWRRVLFETFEGIERSLEDPKDPMQAAEWIRRSTRSWAESTAASLWRPTDQSLREILSSREGRSEDLAHLEVLALRANAIPSTLDFVPAWGARGGNHAWSRLLLKDAPAPEIHNRVAKVLRRKFVQQDATAPFIGDRRMPAWLTDRHAVDVTAEYVDAQQVRLQLPKRTGGRYALAVWEGQAWIPVALGERLTTGDVLFRAMGPEVLYLPLYCDADGDHILGEPFSIARDGWIRSFDGVKFETPGELGSPPARSPDHPVETHGLPCPASTWQLGEHQRLLVWKEGSWHQADAQQAEGGGLWWELPLGRVGLIQSRDAWDPLARPFSVRFDRVRWW